MKDFPVNIDLLCRFRSSAEQKKTIEKLKKGAQIVVATPGRLGDLYQQGFSYLKMGYASAMALILFVIVMLVSFFALRVMEKRVNYDVE